MIKFIIFFIFSSFLLFFMFLNLGRFLDATSKPSSTDLLVCLGGGDYKTRIQKTMELYEKKYLKTDTIILTGYVNSKHEVQKGIVEDKRITFINNHYKDINIIINKNLKNTAEEVKFIKSYMIKNKLENVTFISDPAHSKRILLFSDFLNIKGDENLSYKVVAAYDKYWQKYTYYKNKYSLTYALTEFSKILYGIFVYGILENLGLLETFEDSFKEEIKEGKQFIHKKLTSIAF